MPLSWTSMEELLTTVTLHVALVTEALAVLVIAFAVVEAVIKLAALPFQHFGSGRDRSQEAKEHLRLRMARWFTLALEFELGADILRTAVAPSWMEIGQLAAIAAVRTALNYFLEKEIQRAERRHGKWAVDGHPSPADAPTG